MIKKKATEYKPGDRFLIEDLEVRLQVIDITKRMMGFRETIANLSELLGLLQSDMWDKVEEAYPELTKDWHLKLHHREGEIEIKYRK